MDKKNNNPEKFAELLAARAIERDTACFAQRGRTPSFLSSVMPSFAAS